ncbi:RagB/SusD family nutrient uptake outer membrane protein [Chryseobacterium formosus]|uniref:RagB/SusD family nutrient uptake outer membrane protein n=1 Tax=Chryseobacterium formosus TaxID=1537363 RepID=A0ABT3XRI7_9FLAO|nr:RagB/SusD family nutrient uptake outer membrane protein [Chryseobacterium formosus]MCX8524749.1 RagB/SusD family nutrient uptake outer membrane protein [Chryseobacterium formosus]
MKINKILYSISISALFLTAVSCERYLDTEPISDQTVDVNNPLSTAQRAEEAMTTIYSDFGNEYWQLDYLLNGDAQTDISYAGADNVQNFQQDEYRILATNTNVNRDWGYLSNFMDHCNKILNYVDGAGDLSTVRKNQMKAEASIFRAMYLFHMVQLWGDVPIVTKSFITINSDNFDEAYTQLYPKRQSVNDVYAQIISDLEGAIANAPASSEKYKANKGAAYALLAKVYATKPNPDWAKVKQYSDLVISQGYSLLPVYDHLFDSNHEGNAESIFEANGNASNIWAWCTSMYVGTDWKKFNTPSNDLIKTYNDAGDIQRLNTTVKFSAVGWSDPYWSGNNFPFMNKMRLTDGNQNFYILRLSDILLLKAEADVRTGDFSGAATLINQVRTRVALPAITITSTDDGINKVLAERKSELAFEGHRWFDLKRTGKSISILSQQKNGSGVILPYTSNINQNRLLWPIPQAQLDKNQNLTQNSGY